MMPNESVWKIRTNYIVGWKSLVVLNDNYEMLCVPLEIPLMLCGNTFSAESIFEEQGYRTKIYSDAEPIKYTDDWFSNSAVVHFRPRKRMAQSHSLEICRAYWPFKANEAV